MIYKGTTSPPSLHSEDVDVVATTLPLSSLCSDGGHVEDITGLCIHNAFIVALNVSHYAFVVTVNASRNAL